MTYPYGNLDGQTGSGTTVSGFGPSGCVRSITLPTFSIESIDASCLEDTGFMKKLPSNLIDGGQCTVTGIFNTPVAPSPAQVNATITFPNGSSISGSGFVSEVDNGAAEIGSLMEQTVTFVFDGDTPPAVAGGGGGGGS